MSRRVRTKGRATGDCAGASGIGINAAKGNARPENAAITAPQISMETRAQFFKCSTPTLMKMPKIARPARKTIIATAVDLTDWGMGGEELAGGIRLKPAIAATAMRIVTRLASMATTPAAMSEPDGPEGFMVQLYIISAGATIARRRGQNAKLSAEWISYGRVPTVPVLRTGVSRWASGKRRSTRG